MRTRTMMLLALAALGAMVRGDAQNPPTEKRTSFTINEAVEVPGAVLQPGSYVIRLKGAALQPNILQLFSILQILSPDETHLFALAVSMPDYNLPPPDGAEFTYYERGEGMPRALKAWWYPGSNQHGEQILYPRAQAVPLAESTKQPVLSLPAEMSTMMTQAAQTEPKPQEAGSGPRATQLSTADLQSAPAKKTARMPKTASALPLAAAAGLLCILAALIIETGSIWILRVGTFRGAATVLSAARGKTNGVGMTEPKDFLPEIREQPLLGRGATNELSGIVRRTITATPSPSLKSALARSAGSAVPGMRQVNFL